MKTIKHIWEIPRKDTRERCGKCFRAFKRLEPRHKIPELSPAVSRFPTMCTPCRDKSVVSDTKTNQ